MYSLITKVQVWTPKIVSNMIESKDNAENKIYHVIMAVILKNAILGSFFDKLFFSVKYMSQ